MFVAYASVHNYDCLSLLCLSSGQNKNNAVMQYLTWRVMVGLHEYIQLNFLIAGHTKFGCDYCFGMVKKKFRTRVSCLGDIEEVCMDSYKTILA